jgi:glycosyltransferase involved in cell wall biosynthesis
MSSFNEVDIIEESIRKLIEQQIDVLLIDNGSTDGTVERASQFLNHGLINIEKCIFKENDREVYDWTALLRTKEEISKNLSYEWFLHVDADEIRYSPWSNMNLNEGICYVDKKGYNLINFKLFNFRLVEDINSCENYEEKMVYYSDVEQFNRMQVKAWKKNEFINLHDHGGHLAQVPNPKIFPIRFIHKHYPIRSIEQGSRKILTERLQRYSHSDRKKGWHVQYDHLNISKEELRKKIIWDSNYLRKYDKNEIYNEILLEVSEILSFYTNASNL